LQHVVPDSLPVDVYDDAAWIGVVPFRMTGVRPRFFAAMPWLSAFPELNVRTYVTLDNRPGVYFFSLDAANPLAVILARKFFRLPYFNARMSSRHIGDDIVYSSARVERHAPPATFRGQYRPMSDVFFASRGSLEYFLTARYCLYVADARGNILRGEIHHSPWLLQSAEADIQVNTMTEPHGIHLPATPPLLHFARRLDVKIWLPTRAK
jgi:uncharacterized protein YqjF (DUF2071 family)